MRLGRNLLAGLSSSIWTALLSLAVVPVYINYLGLEAYGLIGFFVTTQSLMQLLDLGLAPAINREVARGIASGCLDEARSLLRTLSTIYWGIALLIVLIVSGLAPLIANYWLNTSLLSTKTVTHAITLMGLVIACRWPIGLYQNALMGAQRLTISSGVSITMATVSSLGAICILAFVSPTVHAFFIWQAIVGIMFAMITRIVALRVVGRSKLCRLDIYGLKRIWRFSAGMSGVAVLGLFLTQMDKVLLSKMLSMEDFGRYMLAWLVASGIYVLLTPVFNVIYPRLSALVATGDIEAVATLYRSGTRLLSSILFPIAIAAVVSAYDLIILWTGNAELASTVAPLASMLLIGTAINGAMHFPYALQLAYGITWVPLLIISVLIIVLTPLMIVLVMHYGVTGGAMAWMFLNTGYLMFGTWLTHRHLLIGVGLDWLVQDILAPVSITIAIIVIGWDVGHVHESSLLNVILSAGLAILAIIVNVVVFLRPQSTILLRQVLQNR
jgi:O-antigen/teichoic acid export membrane protein